MSLQATKPIRMFLVKYRQEAETFRLQFAQSLVFLTESAKKSGTVGYQRVATRY